MKQQLHQYYFTVLHPKSLHITAPRVVQWFLFFIKITCVLADESARKQSKGTEIVASSVCN